MNDTEADVQKSFERVIRGIEATAKGLGIMQLKSGR
jgi:hypothetical protein